MSKLDLVYLTNRLEPKFEWFVDSLDHQAKSDEVELIVVDFHAGNPDRRHAFKEIIRERFEFRHVTPKPTVWQGSHRLTQQDYFAASNASNTGIALCRSEHVVFVDDLSVLQPNWWNCVREATQREGVTCGSYKKVLNLEVENGYVKNFTEDPLGNDIRRRNIKEGELKPCNGQWFFGCSFVASIEDLLRINGYDEDCDGMGYQDVVAGAMLDRWGTQFWYDSRMMTFESQELHSQPGSVFLREDPGQSPHDKSHRILELVRQGRNSAPNYFGEGGLRKLREQMRYTTEFPTCSIPDREWFTGKLLKELPE